MVNVHYYSILRKKISLRYICVHSFLNFVVICGDAINGSSNQQFWVHWQGVNLKILSCFFVFDCFNLRTYKFFLIQ